MSKSNRDQHRTERAAAVQAADARAERNRRLAIIGAVVAVLAVLAAAGFWYTSGGNGSSTAANPPAGAAVVAGDHALLVGPSSAKYHVIVYEDFLCPFCREFEMASRDYLREDAAKGRVQVEYRPFHLLQDGYSIRALDAFAAVLAQSPAKALRFHDLLYDKQPYEQSVDKPDAATLGSWAASVGGDRSAVQQAVQSADTSWLDAANAAANKANVTQTPTVLVNGKELPGATISAMSDNLEKMVANQ